MNNINKIIAYIASNNEMGVYNLLLHGANPNCRDANDRTPLHWAAQENCLSIMKYLLRFGADVDACDNLCFTPLAIAASEGHTAAVHELLRNGAHADVKVPSNANGTALHLAASWDHLEVVKVLVETGAADLNSVDNDGCTPLSFAKANNNIDLIQYLTNKGAM